MAAAIELRHAWKRYRVYRERYRSLKEVAIHRRWGEWEDRWAIRDVTLTVEPSSTYGLVGPNGAGKSTALKLMSRILSPDRGEVVARGRVSGLIEVGAGFQPEYTGRENVFLNASLLGLSRGEIKRRFDQIVEFAELDQFIDAPLRTYSSGMHMRLGFSVAINVDPEILLVDEILAVGDEAFQRKCYEWLKNFQLRGGTLVIVSHNLTAIRTMCDRAAWIERGQVLAEGDSASVVDAYLDEVRDQRIESHETQLPAERPAAEVGEIRLLDRRGRPTAEILSGDSLTVEIDYRVNRPVVTPNFGVMLHRNDGTYVYGCNTNSDGCDVAALERDGCVRFSYHALQLLAGTYYISVALFASTHPHALPIHFREREIRFRVVHSTAEQGLVRIEHDWQTELTESTGEQ